eukprot:scaffold32458_cov59-Phaeocystis_antarctica.AAC.5
MGLRGPRLAKQSFVHARQLVQLGLFRRRKPPAHMVPRPSWGPGSCPNMGACRGRGRRLARGSSMASRTSCCAQAKDLPA